MVSKPTNPVYQSALNTLYNTVVCYPFYEGAGTVIHDLSPSANHCYVGIGSPTWTTDEFGPSVYFDGNLNFVSNSALTISSSSSYTALCLWSSEFDTSYVPWDIEDTLGAGFGYYVLGNLFEPAFLTNNGNSMALASVGNDFIRYNKIGITTDNVTVEFFNNEGQLGTSMSLSGLEYLSGTPNLYLGSFNDGGLALLGNMSYFSLHDRKLTVDEINTWLADPFFLVREPEPQPLRIVTKQKPVKYPLTKTQQKVFANYNNTRLF
jgi:hypothetical protein